MTSIAFTRSRNTPVAIAILTGKYLFVGFFVGMALGSVIGAPNTAAFYIARDVIAGVIVIGIMILASMAWARETARRIGAPDLRRAGLAGALSFGPIALVVGLALTLLERLIVERGQGPAPPLHVIYGMLFVPASFVIASVCAWILGIGLRLSASEQRRLGLTTGLASAAAYLVVYLVMDAAGWQVGAPGAASRATMVVVTSLGCLAAALAGGAALGSVLFGARRDTSR